MSTCPEKDIHSIYLDGELPASYKAKYEEHLKSCEKCRNQLEQLKKAQDLLKKDSSSINLSQKDLEDSYGRLLSRMSYAKATSKTRTYRPVSYRYMLAGAAAAAVVALILPIRVQNSIKEFKGSGNVQTVNFTPVARSYPVPQNYQNVHLDGEITPETISSMAGPAPQSIIYPNAPYASNMGTPEGIQTVSYETMQRASLSSYDMFMVPPEREDLEQPNEIVLHITSPFATLSFEIKGNGN